MTDLPDPVRDDLDAMFRRREGDTASPLRLPVGTRRRVRRRQGAAAAASALAIMAAVSLSVTVFPRPAPVRPLDSRGAPRTSTIQGTTITYPGDWYLVALPQVTSDWAYQEPRSAFRPVLQLSDFDPVSDDVGDAGRRWFCPLVGGRFPDDGSLLYVEAIGGPITDGAPGWPVPFPETAAGVPSGGACSGEGTLDAVWRADGVTYHGVVMGDPNDPDLRAAFDSMRFSGGTPAVVGNVDEGPLTSEAYVLGSGEGDAGSWSLFASPQPDPCLALAFADEPVAWNCGAWSLLSEDVTVVGFADDAVQFGVVLPVTARLEFRHAGGVEEIPIVTLPPSFGGRRAYAFDASGMTAGDVVALDADGAVIGANPAPTPTPTPARTPSVASVVDGRVTLTAEQIRWDAETIEAPADEAFTIEIANRDADVPHDFVLFSPDGETQIAATEIEAGPNEQHVEIPALAPGTYPFMCEVHPTTMAGELVVG